MGKITFEQQFATEEACIAFLEKQRWGENHERRYCSYCFSPKTYAFKNKQLYKCGSCRMQFNVKIGTIFSGSHIPLTKWFQAIYYLTSLKKGISSIQLAKYLEITQKSAWFLAQRIRYGLEEKGLGELLGNVTEVDETYIGGHRRGGLRGPGDKAVVFGAVERGGGAKLRHLNSSGVSSIMPALQRSIESGSTIYSDQWRAYKSLQFRGYSHETVNHSAREYARGPVHTNTIEGAWSHFKKSLESIYISVSRKHLQRYCDEFSYRYSTRKLKDEERFEDWFKHCYGRITYKRLVVA